MFSRFVATTALTVLASSIAIEAASAQDFPWSHQGEYLYREGVSTQRYFNTVPGGVPAANQDNSRSYYPSNEQQVRIHVKVPAAAKITFDGHATKQGGTSRDFESPTLELGYRYTYVIEATWMENGRQVTQKRVVPVHAGDNININLSRDAVGAGQAR